MKWEVDKLFLFMLYGSFAVNKALGWNKTPDWYRAQKKRAFAAPFPFLITFPLSFIALLIHLMPTNLYCGILNLFGAIIGYFTRSCKDRKRKIKKENDNLKKENNNLKNQIQSIKNELEVYKSVDEINNEIVPSPVLSKA